MTLSVAPVEYNYRDRAELERAGITVFLAGENPALSVFLRTHDGVFHTYSTYARGLDGLVNTYNYLDLTPLGRQDQAGGIARFVCHDGQPPLPGHRRSA